MSIKDVSLDVWKLVIEKGKLSIDDVLCLMKVNRTLRALLNDNSVWYTLLYDNYLDWLLQYDLEWAKEMVEARNKDIMSVRFYDICMRLFRKEKGFRSHLNGDLDIRLFLDRFSKDDDYIPILHKIYESYPINYIEQIRKNEVVSFQQKSMVLNLLISQTFKLGLGFFNDLTNTGNELKSPASFENFWFRISLLDSSAHKLIRSRKRVLDKVFGLLNDEITSKIFHSNQITSNVRLIPGVPGETNVLIMDDEDTLMELILKIFKLTLSCLVFDNPLVPIDDTMVFNKYCKSYYLEDFSILRLYSGQVKGHPFLIMSILIKVVNEFLLSKYRIQIGDNEDYEQVHMNITSTYLRVRNYLFSFDRKILSIASDFEIYSISEVIQNLRDRSYFEISKFIEPLDFKYIVECYLHLDYFMDSNSLGLILRPDSYFKKDLVQNLNNHDFGLMTHQNYSFIKLICRYIHDRDTDNDLLDSMFCQELEDSLNHLNTFIHFNTIYNVFKDSPSKQKEIKKYFLRNSEGPDLFTNNFDLGDPESLICYKKVLKSYPFKRIEPSKKEICSGSIVQHRKFDYFGIVLGQVLTNNSSTTFYRVLTTSKSIECYSAASVILVDNNTKWLPEILNFVIKSCGEEMLGSLFFNSLENPFTCPRFVMN